MRNYCGYRVTYLLNLLLLKSKPENARDITIYSTLYLNNISLKLNSITHCLSALYFKYKFFQNNIINK